MPKINCLYCCRLFVDFVIVVVLMCVVFVVVIFVVVFFVVVFSVAVIFAVVVCGCPNIHLMLIKFGPLMYNTARIPVAPSFGVKGCDFLALFVLSGSQAWCLLPFQID